jgi:UDP-2,3-diacylglucosamine hydrolase
MKVAAISDVHVKIPFDDADKALCRFLTHSEVLGSDYVVLLGDIFDLMCGPHPEYFQKFSHIFNLIDQLRLKGVKVMYFEGNHDVHLERLFKMRWPNNEVILSQIPIIEEIGGKSYYFSHGDEHEVDNLNYQKYKSMLLSPALRFVANRLMPYILLNYLGDRASKISRKRGSKDYVEEIVKTRFRNGVRETTQGKYNFILGGHSHVKDSFDISDDSIYLNNGYALKSKTFLLIENHTPSFPLLY